MEEQFFDEVTPENLAAHAHPPRGPNSETDTSQARLKRVNDYAHASLEKPDPLHSNIGSINSGLMRIAISMDEAIQLSINYGPRSIERLQKVIPAIETHLRVTRQVDRFAQFEQRAQRLGKSGGNDHEPDAAKDLDSPPSEEMGT